MSHLSPPTTRLLILGLPLFILLFAVAPEMQAQRNITLRLNTATLPDTLDGVDLMEVRGAIDGVGGVTLPDGNIIDWSNATTLHPTNDNGDYWSIQFQIPDNAQLDFKFYSQRAEDDFIGGWEDGDNHSVASGAGDLTLGLHYFEKGPDQPYDWTPFASQPDMVGVLFRVYMRTADAISKGYDRDNPPIIGVRGDDLGGASPLGWGATNLELNRESDTSTDPGYDIWSGIAYYPTSAVGLSQDYKFFIDPSGWENDINGGNRSFRIPTTDSTLQWVYFSDSPPDSGTSVTGSVQFSVDLTPLEQIGIFDRARGDELQVRGSFNGWACNDPSLCVLTHVPGTSIYESEIDITALEQTPMQYKFFINFDATNFEAAFGIPPPSGWEEPISTTGANRFFTFEGTTGQSLGTQQFNDILSGNILPSGTSTSVSFAVDMDPALGNTSLPPFDPSNHDVIVDFGGDPIWGFTQDLPRSPRATIVGNNLYLDDLDGDGVFSSTLTLLSPTYSGLQYKFGFIDRSTGDTFLEQGADIDDRGRRRTRFLHHDNGQWPSNWQFPQEAFQEEGPLPFEENPETHPPDIRIQLRPQNPPIVIGSNGGRYRAQGRIRNNGAAQADLDVWFNLISPSGRVLQERGPIAISLPSSGVRKFRIKQKVPARAPTGMYHQRAFAGSHPHGMVAQTSFSWEKVASKDGTGVIVSDWASEFAFEDDLEPTVDLPTTYALAPNYPNPFNPTTLIQYALPEAAMVRLRVYNILGQEVQRLVATEQPAGRYDVRFDASRLSAGVYFYVLEAGSFRATRQMVLLK